jgi:hypothetical protein
MFGGGVQTMKSVNVLLAFLLVAATAFAQPKRHIQAFTIDFAYPLLDYKAGTIQWIVPTFSGAYDPGTFNGEQHNRCKDAIQCYYFDGRGHWRFVFSGFLNCVNGCTFTGTGNLKETIVYLPKSSFTKQLTAVLTGTLIDENGVEWDGLTAYYNSDLVDTNLVEINLGNTLAAGSLDIVLAEN